jgi:hypothetical protein
MWRKPCCESVGVTRSTGIALVFFVVGWAGCSDPFSFDSESQGEEDCAASSEWLPNTPALDLFKPLPHPASECAFYRGGWQTFLIATQPDAAGKPALLSFPTIETVFKSSKPAPKAFSQLGFLRQAGGRQILVDQNGNPIYYGIHVNQAFADFVKKNGLQTAQAIVASDPALFFPAGVAEFKSAWQIVEGNTPSDGWITVQTTVPTLSLDTNHRVVENRTVPRAVTVRLLALHAVFTLPGHPEFIWATFEHSAGAPDSQAGDGKRDVAPTTSQNPDPADPENLRDGKPVDAADHVLYHGGTAANAANKALDETTIQLDAVAQKFPGQQTSIYRMFPASKSNTIEPDDSISSLNTNVEGLFASASVSPADRRGHYRLVGAVWMDKPEHFANNVSLQNDETSPFAKDPNYIKDITENGSDSPLSILAGEDRLSSTAMESFTQGPDSFPNCFTCHNTQAITLRGVPINRDSSGTIVLQPKLLNVSHVLSQFVISETTGQ